MLIMISRSKQFKRNNSLPLLSTLLLFSIMTFAGHNAHSNEQDHQPHQQTGFGPGDNFLHPMAVNQNDYSHIADISKDASSLPASLQRKYATTIKVKLEATEVISEIAKGISYHYWTFNNTVPGPMLRIKQGDTVELTLHNDKTSSHSHSIDLHAVTGPGGGALITEVEPGETRVMRFKAKQAGLYVYHCASGNAATHIANGMYGLILVEPIAGLSKVDKEFYLMQGEFYTRGEMGKRGFQAFDPRKMINERPEYVVFNGRTGALTKNGTLKAKVGDRIRIYIGNAGVAKILSFHIIGEIFDRVYPEASISSPLKNVQTTLIPAGGGSIVEFAVDYPGNYVLVDHALTRIDRGAWGILQVTGKKNNKLYHAVSAEKSHKTTTHRSSIH